MIGFYAGDNDLTSYSVSYAVIDSGTSLFYLNPGLYNQIVAEYLSPWGILFGTYYCRCD